ncbi:Vitamin K epoxide reductase family protein [uncultured archaeon]|nr:Vitamin K epoxide reductase family protein [uncultured archaeon]
MGFKKEHWIILLSIIALILTGIIHYEREIALNEIQGASLCTGGCDAVQTSDYALTFGIPNTIIGFVGFTLLIIIELIQLKKGKNKKLELITEIMITIALLMSLRWLYLQKFVIQQWCIYCIFVDLITIILSIIILKKHFVKK